MISELTKAQKDKIPEYLETYLALGLSTDPCDRSKAEAAISASYVYNKQAVPKFIWVDSPFKGRIIAAQLAQGREDVTQAEVAEQASKASYGSFEAYWLVFYAFIAEQLPVKKDGLIDIVKEIIKNCGVYWTFEDVVVISDKPCSLSWKDKKLNNKDGLAHEYRDGTGFYSCEGKSYSSLLEMVIANASNEKT